MSAIGIDGERTSGQDIRTQNVTACVAIANIVKSSLGPVGLDKMLVDDIGEFTITNDGATILKKLEVEHAAAKVLVETAVRQDNEVGDGTTSVVILAAELLKRGNELVRQKIHPSTVISGFKLARKESINFIKRHLIVPTDKMQREYLVNAAKTAMSSKIIGVSPDHFSNLAVDAVTAVRRVLPSGKVQYPVGSINVLKAHGRSALESALVPGFALNCTKASMAMPTRVPAAKIALLDFDLKKHRMAMGVQILVKDPKELEAIRQRESDITKEKIEKLLAAGANVIMTTKGIDDTCMKYLVEAGCMGVRRCAEKDLRRIANATGGVLLPNLADLEGEESVDAAMLGDAEEVCEERVGDGFLIFVRGCATSQAVSVVLRGANESMLDEMDRSLHDVMCVVKRVLESKSVVAGGGSVEAALAIYLENFATTLGTREQLAISEFGKALLVIPKTLAVNAAKDATDLVAKLCRFHNTAQRVEEKAAYKYMGLDLYTGRCVDNMAAGVVEPAMSKVKSLRFATEAAVTILRVDDFIKINPAQGAGAGAGGHH